MDNRGLGASRRRPSCGSRGSLLAVDRGDEVAALFLALFAVLIALLALYNAEHIRLEVDAGSDEQSDATVSDETPPESA